MGTGSVDRTIHDLNNALTRILTAAELIEYEVHDEQAATDARDIRQAAVASRDLVRALTDQIDTIQACR